MSLKVKNFSLAVFLLSNTSRNYLFKMPVGVGCLQELRGISAIPVPKKCERWLFSAVLEVYSIGYEEFLKHAAQTALKQEQSARCM